MMRIGSLFSGIGGIELGFERAGFTTEWFVEKDRYCQAILRKNFPRALIYGDITTLDFAAVPKVEIITGGFPCQDISVAGNRKGITGSRSGLWKYYLKAISEIRPKFAVIENVAALTTNGLAVVLADLASCGYDAEWDCIPAAAIGAPHQRDRIFIVAYPRHSELSGWFEDEEGCERETRYKSTSRSFFISDSDHKRQPREGEIQVRCEKLPNSDAIRKRQQELLWQNWNAEPDVGRVAHGVPFRVDRIKCLGNAVVPQVAEVIAQAIKVHINNSYQVIR